MSSSSSTNEQSASDERLRLEFNEWARAGRGDGMEKGHRPAGEQAIELLAITGAARVLDVGCGTGWATRLMAKQAGAGRVVGIDIADEMIRLARESSRFFANIQFQTASAEKLPFGNAEFTHAFSMESLYYYADIPRALREIKRVLGPGGVFVMVVDLYQENIPSHQWIEQLKVPVQLLSIAEYRSLFAAAGFVNVRDRRLYDHAPISENYSGGSFKTREEYVNYKESGSLMVSGEVAR